MDRDHDLTEPLKPPRAVEVECGLPPGTLSSRRLAQPDAPPHYRISLKVILLQPSQVRHWLEERERRGGEQRRAVG